MNEITQITSQKKNDDRLNIFLDGEFAFGVQYETAVKFGLKVGKTLTDSDIAAINAEEGNTAAFNRGLKYAVKKTVSEKQLKDYLARVGYSQEAVETAVKKLKAYGYVDDVAFARAYIATYGGERGSKRLEFELKKAGIKQSIIDEELSVVENNDACMACVNKYLRTHSKADRQKLFNYLLYRGFDYDEINDCINRSGL